MKKLIFLIYLLSTATVCFSEIETEIYAVGRDDGGISVIYYIPGSSKSLENILRSQGLIGKPIKRITKSDFPAREDRKYWKLNDVPVGKKIIVDTVAKQADETANQVKEERKRLLFKMTPAEYAEAKQLGIVK